MSTVCKGTSSYDCKLQTCHGLPQCGSCCKCLGSCQIEAENSGPPTIEVVDSGVFLHRWPKETDHLWGPWMIYSKTEHRRLCLHPRCAAIELKKAPKA